MRSIAHSLALLLPALLAVLMPTTLMASGNVRKVKHVIIVMQENHSFDNYFGALAYAPGSPYHKPSAVSGGSPHRLQPKRSRLCRRPGLRDRRRRQFHLLEL